jgi:hypothetical protein
VVALVIAVTRAASADEPSSPMTKVVTTSEQDEDYESVRIQGTSWSSQRGLGDTRIKRELLEASPRLQTSEMLSAAPGFFVDHEEGEGIGNDVYLRGFDLDHGSGIEMRIGSIPLNSPIHIRGQGYADPNFIIPEIVRSIRVLEGPYDPRQGDAAIVGSAYFDLGVDRRGYQLKTTYGSFDQVRVVGVAAPPDADPETFSAFSLRRSSGFGVNRDVFSGSANGQVGIDLGPRDHLRLLGTAYVTRGDRPGVVRQDDVDAGRIDLYGAYPFFAENQSVESSRILLGADLDHLAESGAHFEVAPWITLTRFRARQNFAGALETSQRTPSLSGLGDLFETSNREAAAGVTSRLRPTPWRAGPAELIVEPGVSLRAGTTDQEKSLVVPATLVTWDRRIDATVGTLDAGAYVDLDLRLARRIRISAGPRADLLVYSIDDRIAGRTRDAAGVALSPRATVQVELAPWITPALSYGEGFRSLDAESVTDGSSRPFSKVRSAEAGLHAKVAGERYTATVAAFETWVENELVFAAEAGGLETERASTRKGIVGSTVAKPVDWLLLSTSVSFTSAVFETNVPGVAHFVPNVPPILWRTDASVRGTVGRLRGKPILGRAGVGYTMLSGRHLTDTLRSPAIHALNAGASARYDAVEVGIDAYNLIDAKYAEESSVYASNWSLRPGQQLASTATHLTAAPPLTLLATVTLFL